MAPDDGNGAFAAAAAFLMRVLIQDHWLGTFEPTDRTSQRARQPRAHARACWHCWHCFEDLWNPALISTQKGVIGNLKMLATQISVLSTSHFSNQAT